MVIDEQFSKIDPDSLDSMIPVILTGFKKYELVHYEQSIIEQIDFENLIKEEADFKTSKEFWKTILQ